MRASTGLRYVRQRLTTLLLKYIHSTDSKTRSLACATVLGYRTTPRSEVQIVLLPHMH